MKLSFSISSKSSSSRPTSKPPRSFNPTGDCNHQDGRHDEAKPHFVTVFDPSEIPSSDSTVQRVIPPIPNSNHRSNTKKKDLPLPTADEQSAESRFVLNASGSGSSEASQYGLMLRSNGTKAKSLKGNDARLSEKMRYRELIKELPDEELPDVPVEGFGAANLAGYGWVEGKPIGRNSKEDPKVFEYKPKAGTEGFGYSPTLGKKTQKEEVAAGFKSVNVKNDYTDDRDKGKFDSREMKKASKDRRSEERTNEEKRTKYDFTTTAEKSAVRWLRSHIRVRIISKKIGGGKLYLKKGEVVDVVSPTTCDIKMDESGKLVQGIDQEILETALPKRGGSVLVLYGKHKNVYGSLVEKDSEKVTGLVRDANSHALINVPLEQIAEYVGDPSCLGY
ncbi:protein MOS2-like [Phalaenopsis equestris]|uniref:protein MOS2-like n=1 Tax=Phalaenopsis equestris TaxID=78828 RepID=UPI0009E646EF|nr:protein MOS2-like [Phalaenopsis equestris]